MIEIDRRRLLLGSAAAALAGGGLPRLAAAQDWRPRWDETVKLAKQEGQVTLCASSNRSRREYVLAQWQKDYPEIHLSYQVVSGTAFVPAVATERRAGKYLWDVWHNGPPSGMSAYHAGLLDPVLPELILPEVADERVWGGWQDAFYDPERRYLLGLFSDVTAPYYNAKLLAPEKVQRLRLKVLLEPELKGKIVWYDPRIQGPGAPYLALLDHHLGSDGLRRVFTEQDVTFVPNANEAAAAVVRGRAHFALANRPNEALREYIAAGLDLDIRPVGNGPDAGYYGTGGATIGVFNNRPHPNAARLFVNWIASQRVGAGLAKAQDLDSRRNDVPTLDPQYAAIAGADYINGQREEAEIVVRKWQAELKQIRPR